MANENHADFTPSISDSHITPEKAPYAPVGSFKFWAQKVLPTVYDDSLSYYEVLTKLVWHINKMIEDMDNFNQTIDSTLSAYNSTQEYVNTIKNTMVETYEELQDYVNHYFDNLDVQNEINHKLDIMATDGSLSAVVAPLIPNVITEWLNTHIEPVGSAVVVDNTLTVAGAAADSAAVGKFKNALTEQVCSFNAIGDISIAIKNVKVYGSGVTRYAITNINRNYNNFTGLVIYNVVDNSLVNPRTISLANLSGHYIAYLENHEAVEFDYRISSLLRDGERITVQDNTAVVNESCYVKESSYENIAESTSSIYNVTIISPGVDTYYIANINRVTDSGLAVLYSANNNYNRIGDITLPSLKGSIHTFVGANKIEVLLDYDLTQIPENGRIGGYVDGTTQIKNSRVILDPDYDIFNIKDYASVGLFETMGVIGDSYASGLIYKTTDTQHPYRCWAMSWIQIMARNVGNIASNFSFGGLTTRSWLTHPYGKDKLESEAAKQIYFLCLGINDANALGLNYLGSGADYNNNNDTFYGNYSHIIRIIQAHAPDARIIMFTTPFTSNETYIAFNNAIIAIARHFGLPCIQQSNDSYISSSYFQNGLQSGHPNAVMYSGMSVAYKKLIEKCMIDNPDYFKNFTGSGSNS